MSRRWNVERTRDNFESVRAESVCIESGCLVFFEGPSDSELVLAFAPGQWLTLSLEEQ